MTQAIKVSKQGKDVLTETNRNNLIFDSQLNTFKIVHQGTASLNCTVGTNRYQFAHNSPLSDTSCIFAFIEFPDGYVTVPSYTSVQSASYNGSAATSQWCFDQDNIYFFLNPPNNLTIKTSWFVFEPPL